jgi:hypothetical protein
MQSLRGIEILSEKMIHTGRVDKNPVHLAFSTQKMGAVHGAGRVLRNNPNEAC